MLRITSVCRLVCGVLVTVSSLSAQTVNLPDFSDVSGFMLNEQAVQSGNVLRVAPSGLMNRGSAYWTQPLSVSNGFDTTFTFQISQVQGCGGSGLTFIIQNDPRGLTATGAPAHAMGYGATTVPTDAIVNSLVLEIDQFLDVNKNDPSHSHLGIHTNGTMANDQHENYSIGAYPTPTDLSDSNVHTVRIVYIPGTIQVYLDNSAAPVITSSYDFATGGNFTAGGTVGGLSLINNEFAYVGFTAAMPNTTAQLQHHDVLSWNWVTNMPPAYPGNGADAAIEVAINGVIALDPTGVHPVVAADTTGFRFHSPNGSLDGEEFAMILSLFSAGMPPAGLSLLPGNPLNVWIDPANASVPLNGLAPGSVFTPTLVAGGFNYGPFTTPVGLSGLSVNLQLFAQAPGFNPVNLGLSNAVELQFQ
ncbi:MAG: hypothetical protein KDB53_10225 [Planctomycetes bacterium]|nr:hypothetical protein [Planctomycetota bacterium]